MPQTDQEVLVNISELTLTPFTGASLVNEILKGLIFQKCQIPFPFSWLKTIVEKRRKKLNSDDYVPTKLNFTHETHFRRVSVTYDALDLIMKGIIKEFCETNSIIKEVVVGFGSTPTCLKEVFTIMLPPTVKGHIERNHIYQLNKDLQKVLRNIFLSQTWMDSIDASITCTNTFIYLKRQGDSNIYDNEAFEICRPFQISSNTKHSKFIISYSHNTSERTNCCDSLAIFEKNGDGTIQQNKKPLDVEENIIWCRSKGIVKGFKDSFIDKVSVCELW